VITATGVDLFDNDCTLGTDEVSPVDTRIVGLNIVSAELFVMFGNRSNQITLADNELTGAGWGSPWSQIYVWEDSIHQCGQPGHLNDAPSTQWFLVENLHTTSSYKRNVTMTAENSAMLGNTFGSSTDSHIVRWSVMNSSIISHNKWTGSISGSGGHHLKWHAGKFADGDFGGLNQHAVFSHNLLAATATPLSWPFTIGQQAGQDQRVSRVIIEDNYFIDGDGDAQIFFIISADETRVSNNICEQRVSDVNGIDCILFWLRDFWTINGNHRVVGNHLYDNTSGSHNTTVATFEGGSNNDASDNVSYAPNNSGTVRGLYDPNTTCGTCTDNYGITSDPPFGTGPTGPECVADPSAIDEYEICRSLP
jgi:hypothetical protein